MAAVSIAGLLTKSRDFINFFVYNNANRSKMLTDDDGMLKPAFDLVWQGIGRKIIIARDLAQKHITDGSSHDKKLLMMFSENLK